MRQQPGTAKGVLFFLLEDETGLANVVVGPRVHHRFPELVRLGWVYGSVIDEDELFFQNTYLTAVAKTIAARVLGLKAEEPDDMLRGAAFDAAGVHGVVEADFFDWTLDAAGGAGSRQAHRPGDGALRSGGRAGGRSERAIRIAGGPPTAEGTG